MHFAVRRTRARLAERKEQEVGIALRGARWSKPHKLIVMVTTISSAATPMPRFCHVRNLAAGRHARTRARVKGFAIRALRPQSLAAQS